VTKALLLPSKKPKRENGAPPPRFNRAKVARVVNRAAADAAAGAPPQGLAPAPVGLVPPKHEMAPIVGGPVPLDSLLEQQRQQQQQQQDARLRCHDYGTANGRGGPEVVAGDRRSSACTALDSFGSRRSSLSSILGVSGMEGGAGAEAWEGGDMSGGGGGGRVAMDEHGAGGGSAEGGSAEAEHAAKMMAARRNSLENALYGTAHRRSSFQPWASFFSCSLLLVDWRQRRWFSCRE